MPPEFNSDTLERIVTHTLHSLDSAKRDIYDLTETAREEVNALQQDLTSTQNDLAALFVDIEATEKEFKLARVRLAEVSRKFGEYSEDMVKTTYDRAYQLQAQLMLLQEREKLMRRRRDDLQRRLKNIDNTIDKATGLINHLSVVITYMSGSMLHIGTTLKDIEQTKYVGTQIIYAQEEERKRVAREIHDGPAQAMANVVLRAELCERMLDRDLGRVRQELRELKETVRKSLAEVRQIIFDLRPMALDDLGLVPTLRKYLADFQEKTDVKSSFTLLGEDCRFNSAVELAMFRLIQEALNNVRKHAKASACRVKLEIKEDAVLVQVKDNGQGFDLEALDQRPEHRSFGVVGMRERVNLLGGEIDFQSALGKGTTVSIRIPVDRFGEEERKSHATGDSRAVGR